MSPHRTLKKNILRNVRDQPLHFLWAGASFILPFVTYRYLGVLAMLVAIVLSLMSLAFLFYREWMQYPSHDWWDARLDWSFYAIGGVTGVVLGVFLL